MVRFVGVVWIFVRGGIPEGLMFQGGPVWWFLPGWFLGLIVLGWMGVFFGGFLLGLNIRVSVFVERGGFVWGGVPSEAISGGIIAPRWFLPEDWLSWELVSKRFCLWVMVRVFLPPENVSGEGWVRRY